MGLFANTPPPPLEEHDTLREWKAQPFSKRYRVGLAVMIRMMSFVVALAGVALFIAEPSWRSVTFTLIIWLVSVPLTAFGYVRKMDRAAASVPPISAASKDPTTTVDIRTRQQRG
jgi:hypothetical protein